MSSGIGRQALFKHSNPGHLQARAFQEAGPIHAFSTREGGVSLPPYHSLNLSFGVGDDPEAVKENRRRFFRALAVEPYRVVRVQQVHGDGVLVVDRGLAWREGLPHDAMVTSLPGHALVISTADCLPILLFDPRRRAIGAVHAGWRSTVKRIAEKTMNTMVEVYDTDPGDVIAAIGPGIGVCCYEVDDPVVELLSRSLPHWRAFATAKTNGRFNLDLSGINAKMLEEAGLRREHILQLGLCTACRPDLFYSYRREKPRTGRMLSLIMLKP